MDFLTVEEVATELRLSIETVKRLLRRNELPGYKVGNVWRIDKAEYDEWKKQRKNKYKSEQES